MTTCSTGWSRFDGYCYIYLGSYETYWGGDALCKAIKAHLRPPYTENVITPEMTFLQDFMTVPAYKAIWAEDRGFGKCTVYGWLPFNNTYDDNYNWKFKKFACLAGHINPTVCRSNCRLGYNATGADGACQGKSFRQNVLL